MNQSQRKSRGWHIKGAMAALLCGCMLVQTTETAVFAAQRSNSGTAVLVPDDAAETKPQEEWGDKPDEAIPFGAYALGSTDFYRQEGKSVTMKVYAWSDRDELTYIWYDPAGVEMQEESDTLTIEELTDGEESGFGTYLCVVSDGTEEKEIEFQVSLDSTLAVEYGSESKKECYVGEPVNLSVLAEDFGESEKEISYQWYRDKTCLDNETAAELTVPHKGKEGTTVKYRCEVTNGDITVTKEFEVHTKANNFSAELVTQEEHAKDDHDYYYKAWTEHTWDVKLINYNPYAEYKYSWYWKKKDSSGGRFYMTEGVDGSSLTVENATGYVMEYSCDITDGTNKYTLINYYNSLYDDVSADEKTAYAKTGNQAFISLDVHAAEGVDKSTISYQWYKGSSDYADRAELLKGETDTVLWFSEVAEEDYGDYFCRISWGDGKTNDVGCSLESYKYSIRQSEIGAFYGDEITFTVGSDLMNEQDKDVAYQWYRRVRGDKKQVEPIAGANGKTLTITYAQDIRSDLYFCEVTESDGSKYTSYVSEGIDLLNGPASWIGGGADTFYINKKYGDKILLDSLVNAGSEVADEIRYVWKKRVGRDYDGTYQSDWVNLDSSEQTYEVNFDELDSDDEMYSVRELHDTSTTSTTLSREFSIKTEETMTSKVVTQLEDSGVIHAVIGDKIKLEVEASSIMEKPVFHWKKSVITEDGDEEITELRGQNKSYEVSVADETKYGTYICEITDGNQTHCYKFPIVDYQMICDTEKETISVYPGQKNVSLTADASYENKNEKLTYQWMKQSIDENGEITEVPIEGQTNKTLVFDKVTADDLGNYVCVVSAAGKNVRTSYELIWSDQIMLNGMKGQQSLICYADYGEKVRLAAAADIPAGETVSYQWMKKSADEESVYVPIEDAVFAEFNVMIEDKSDFGGYRCRITINDVSYDVYAEIKNRDAGNLCARAENTYSNVKNTAYAIGQTAEFRAVACCASHELQYQWAKAAAGSDDFKVIEGEQQPVCSISVKSQEDYGVYRCEISCVADDAREYVYYNVMESMPEPDDTEVTEGTETPGNPGTTETPVRPEESESTETPVSTEESESTETPSTEESESTEAPSTEESESTEAPSTEESESTEAPSTEESESTEAPVRPGESESTEAPSTEESESTETPSTEELESTETPSTEESESTEAPVRPGESESTEAPSTEESESTEAPVRPGESESTEVPENSQMPETPDSSEKQPPVTAIPAANIYLLSSKNMVVGTEYQLTATILPSDSTDKVKWKSSNIKTVRVDGKGKIKAIAAGTARVTAETESGKKAVCTITVVKKKVKTIRVKLNKTNASVKVGDVIHLKASVTPVKSTDNLKWRSSNKKVASVDKNGVVVAKKAGTAKITVKTDNGKTDTCIITVKQPALSVRIDKSQATVKAGKTIQLKVIVTPSDSSERLTWKSSNKKIATVNKKGKVTGIKKGKVTITVKTSGGKTAKCKVTVK